MVLPYSCQQLPFHSYLSRPPTNTEKPPPQSSVSFTQRYSANKKFVIESPKISWSMPSLTEELRNTISSGNPGTRAADIKHGSASFKEAMRKVFQRHHPECSSHCREVHQVLHYHPIDAANAHIALRRSEKPLYRIASGKRCYYGPPSRAQGAPRRPPTKLLTWNEIPTSTANLWNP